MKEQRILSIDYGKKRIGIALSDPLLTFAYSFTTLINDKKLWKNITEIINEKKVV
ncbi:MAG: Holliday junction resolvase RuvX, partial [Ignavibacteriae bacterium]